jgi:hypothetical protein
MTRQTNRRTFLQSSLPLGAGLLVLGDSRLAFGAEANDRLNIAAVGVAGMGAGNVNNLSSQNIVALCDVHESRAAKTYEKHPEAKVYSDFRRMFDELDSQIDAVVVSTPDHTHAVSAVAAMKRGKHVYCEKPLTRTVYEARVMRETAVRYGVVTQMGNQGSASEGLRRAVELAWAGTVGPVQRAHLWFGGGDGPRQRPADEPPVPPDLQWDLWLGPAPYRPYHPCYCPATWRGWRDFGSGGMGDMGCHAANMLFRSLHLDRLWNLDSGSPKPERVVIRFDGQASEVDVEGYPRWMIIDIEIPARGDLPPVKLTLYTGGRHPSEEVMRGDEMTKWGALLDGSRGAIFTDCPWNTRYALLPKAEFEGFQGPERTLPRVAGHHLEWIEACKGRGETFSSFAVGGPLTECIQLANVAATVCEPFEYDTLSGQILNHPAANALLHREYREGWTL